MSQDESSQQAGNAALRLLSYRPRSEAEIKKRLLPRFPQDTVDEVVQRLKDQTLLNDADFCQFWCHSRNSSNPRSTFLLKQELIAKGVNPDIIDEALKDIDDVEQAYKAGLRGARRVNTESLAVFRRKMWGVLHRRGFAFSVIEETINRIWNECKKTERSS